MGEERRTSRRSEFRLPFQWQCLASGESLQTQIARWSLENILNAQQRFAALNADFEQAAMAVKDPATSTALRALQSRLDLLQSTSFSAGGNPPPAHLELSADGIGFHSEQLLPIATELAVHVVLPDGYHLVAGAQVSHARAISGQSSRISERGYRIGAELTTTDAVGARRLTRLIIS